MFKYLSIFLFAILLVESKIANQDWWKHGHFYQIYPRSFKDSDNNGTGDLQGIIQKLDHFNPEAGGINVTGIWLSPIYESPGVDQGYDISNYTAVDPLFGTLDDLKELIKKAHEIGVRIIMDLVPNHTSDQHLWFKLSENRTEGYEDYYVWVDGTPDQPPNNWVSNFAGSAWEWSEKRQQWYLHQFAIQQPDLNYRNPKVHEEMKNVMKFYLDLGVDGFRIDAFQYAYEDETFPDEPRSNAPDVDPTNYNYLDHIYTANLPETYDLIKEFRKFVDDYSDQNDEDTKVLMTEVYATLEQTIPYYGNDDGSELGAHFSFNFFMIRGFDLNTSTAYDLERIVYTWLNALPEIYTSNWVLGNHDNRRYPTRLGVENKDGFNMLLMLLPGISITYNGEEFGQEDGEVTYDQGKDPSARDPATFEQISRDFERTPLQWDNSTNAGFDEGAPTWLPVSDKYHELNLENQLNHAESHYGIFNSLSGIRQIDAVRSGTTNIWAMSNDTIVLKRSLDNNHVVLAFKLGWHGNNDEETILIPDTKCKTGTVVITNADSKYEVGQSVDVQNVVLKPHESLTIFLDDYSCN